VKKIAKRIAADSDNEDDFDILEDIKMDVDRPSNSRHGKGDCLTRL
jgi:hypothetical protein